MEKGIAFAGNLIVDQIKKVDFYPAPNALATITGATPATGGLVCNCVLGMAKLAPEVPVRALGIVGEDEMGDYIVSQLAAHPSVNTSGILRRGGTSYTDVMTDPEGNRTFFQYRGANALFGPEHVDISKLEADILHIGYILLLDAMDAPDADYGTALCRVLHSAKQAGIATSVDVVSEDSDRFTTIVPPALRYTDYCIINEMEAERTTGVPLRAAEGGLLPRNMLPACEKLMEMGVGRWVVIHTPEVSCGLEKGGAFVQEDSWYIPKGFKKSSVGAGDAFATAILLSAYKGWDIAKAIHVAGAVAAHSLSGTGATDAILPLNELMANMEALKG